MFLWDATVTGMQAHGSTQQATDPTRYHTQAQFPEARWAGYPARQGSEERSGGRRQLKVEGAAYTHLRFDPHSTMVAIHDPLDDREP
jgi:hypothetical protein